MVTRLVLKTSMTHLNLEGSGIQFLREYYYVRLLWICLYKHYMIS